MTAPLREFQSLVLNQNLQRSLSAIDDHLFARVHDGIRALRMGSQDVGPADIAALLRQAILRAHLTLGETPELRVPRVAGWPTDADWQRFDCDVFIANAEHYLVRPRAWLPVWLDSGASTVIEAAIGEIGRRQFRSVPSDPLVEICAGFADYVTPGQRSAVQAAFLIPPGTTAVVNLPTGGGKTLAFQMPALAWANEGGLTVVIVPTVALGRDQEERFRELWRYHRASSPTNLPPLAYHSGLSEEEKATIRSSLRDGSLPILLCSPEAAMGSLRGSLFETAQQGRLRCFAVDEAHIVTQWGQQFRPEFQTIAGLKDALLDVCPRAARFRTLLLTATLTEECWQALKSLFGKGGCQLISEVSLRPEPGFLIYSADDSKDKEQRLLEAVRKLPRPLILYTTLRDDAQFWYQKLLLDGFRRVRLVRGGDLADAEGEQLLLAWRTRSVDAVVATSAFGLGMDQAEVRSIIHACLPETLDRYYQEVGRAGRDGRSAVALLVSTPEDVRIAEELTRERIISVDRGFERWEAMWLRRTPVGNETFLLSLDHRPADITDPGLRNASWNLRTLVLMARAGLLSFAPIPPPRVEPVAGEDASLFEQRRREIFESFARQVGVRLLDPRHSDKAHWEIAVGSTRLTLRATDSAAARLVQQLRHLSVPLNDLFREVYTIGDPPIRPPRLTGSCPVTRARDNVSFVTTDPELLGMTSTTLALGAEMERALAPCKDSVGRFWVAYDSVPNEQRALRRWRERLINLLRYLVSGGVTEFYFPEGTLASAEWTQLTMRSPHRFLIRGSSVEDRNPGQGCVPRLTFVDEKHNSALEVEQIMTIYNPQHIVLAPKDTIDPRSPNRRLFDMVGHLSIDEVLSRLQS